MQPEIKKITCPNCSSKQTKKHGIKRKKLQTLQRYFCNNCRKTFTLQPDKNKTYPLKIILSALSYYNIGHSQTEAANMLSKRFKLKPSQKAISNWLNEYKELCAYSRLRKEAIKLYSPKNTIKKLELSHIQPYTFKYHKAKLYLLFHSRLYNNQFHNISLFYEPLKNYLEKIGTDKFPHHIFTYDKTTSSPDATACGAENRAFSSAEVDIKNFNESQLNNQISKNLATSVRDKENTTTSASGPDAGVAKNSDVIENKLLQNRASQIKFDHLKIEIKDKNNFACKLAKLALNLAATNKDRHQVIQNFFLVNDSTTIAVEMPVYFTNWDAGYFRCLKTRDFRHHAGWNQKGFIFPLSHYATPITGHIDILQIRNGLIHILDYKPEAGKINPIEQLTIYALALSRKLNLPLYYFKCAWFDENDYFEFFPLHAVYELRQP